MGAVHSSSIAVPGHLWYQQWAVPWPSMVWAGSRLTSIPPSASACETMWSHIDWIHSKKRNRLGQVLVEKMVRAHGNLVLQEHWDDADNVLPGEQDMTISAADCRDNTTTQGDKVEKEEEDDEDEDSSDDSSFDSDSSSEDEGASDDDNLGDRQRERKRKRLAADVATAAT